MKLSPSGMKNMNWKQFFVDHGEKLFLGVVALLGLVALGLTRWAPYSEKSPYELQQAVAQAEVDHQNSTWPEAEREELTSSDDIYAKAQQLLSPLEDSRYVFSRTLREIFPPIVPQKQPLEEPRWYPVQRLIADASTVLYAKAPSMDALLAAAEAEEAAAEEESQSATQNTGPRGIDTGAFTPSAARRSQGLPGFGPGEGMAEGYVPPGGAEEATAAGRGRGSARGSRRGSARGGSGGPAGGHGGGGSGAMPGADFYGGEYAGEYGSGMMGGYGMAGPIEAEAKRFVSVRGVFPIKDQETALARALGAQSAAQVVNALQFEDFELQRQTAVQGRNPWSGPWEAVDHQIAIDVLSEQANFSADIVDQSVTNAVFTMPLPNRLMGEWQESTASHPALTQFELTEDARKQQLWLQTKIAEYAELMKEQEAARPQPGGFAALTYDTRQIGSMMAMDSGYMTDMASEYSEYSGGGGFGMSRPMARGARRQTGLDKIKPEDIKNMLTASGTYLLFRYLDFDVEPGNAYRYRVRLKVQNPNFGRDPGEATAHSVVEGASRLTPWSEPTPVAIVPDDTRHFLVEIERPVSNQADRALFELFQWSREFGTYVREFLAVERGQFVGGTTETPVIDPAGGTFEEQKFTFTSNEALVDINRNGMFVAGRTELGVSDRRFQIPAQVLTVNDWGGLEVQDPVSTRGNRVAWENWMAGVASSFDYLKQQTVATGEAGMEYMEEGMYDAEMTRGSRGSGPASPLRRGRGRGAAGSFSGSMP